MIKKDLVLYAVVGILAVGGAYTLGVQYPEEQQEQLNESKQVAANWKLVDSTQTSCQEMRDKVGGLVNEDFDGKELIITAIMDKYKEFEC